MIEKATLTPTSIVREDVELVQRAGWSDEAIYDAITVCALFNFYNRWTDAMGIGEMTDAEYSEVGQRLMAHGYQTFGSSAAAWRHNQSGDE